MFKNNEVSTEATVCAFHAVFLCLFVCFSFFLSSIVGWFPSLFQSTFSQSAYTQFHDVGFLEDCTGACVCLHRPTVD